MPMIRPQDSLRSQNSSNSSNSESVFGSDKPFSNHSISGGGGIMVPFNAVDVVVAVENLVRGTMGMREKWLQRAENAEQAAQATRVFVP